ncbi:MAG: hypothetical protein LH610_05995 [Sphingomonas bacterium]|nr:hypothetical protein [Sphingomonas bacterium]
MADVVHDIVDLVSDDVYGLWEVDWWFNSNHPHCDSEERAGHLLTAVRRGWVDVYFGSMRDRLAPLSLEVAEANITDWSNWKPPENADQNFHHVMANEQGLIALQSRERA